MVAITNQSSSVLFGITYMIQSMCKYRCLPWSSTISQLYCLQFWFLGACTADILRGFLHFKTDFTSLGKSFHYLVCWSSTFLKRSSSFWRPGERPFKAFLWQMVLKNKTKNTFAGSHGPKKLYFRIFAILVYENWLELHAHSVLWRG